MSRIGTVIELMEGKALVSTSLRGVCDGCGKKDSCAFDYALGKGRPEQVVAENPVRATPGDLVEFDLAGHAELRVSLLVWGAPIVGLIAGAFFGERLHLPLGLSSDAATLIGAFAGLALIFALLIAYDRLFAKKDRALTPRITRVVKHPCPEEGADGNQRSS